MTKRDDIFAAIEAGLPVFVGVAAMPSREGCPSPEAPLRGGVSLAFRTHTFRWSTKICAHCGLELARFGGSNVFFEERDAPTGEEWDAYVAPIEVKGLFPCR